MQPPIRTARRTPLCTPVCAKPIALLCLALAASVSALSQAQEPGNGLTVLADRPLAPDFELLDIDAERHRLSDYRGRVVILNFWATWCPPCREEMPSMERAWRLLQPEGIQMLAVNVGEDEDTVFAFTANYPLSFPLLLDQSAAVTEQWPIRGLPTTFVVDPRGRLAYRAIGGRAWDDEELIDQVRALQDDLVLRVRDGAETRAGIDRVAADPKAMQRRVDATPARRRAAGAPQDASGR